MGWVVSVTPPPRPRFTPGEKIPSTHCTGRLMAEVRGNNPRSLPGIEPRSPGRPARSQTLYRHKNKSGKFLDKLNNYYRPMNNSAPVKQLQLDERSFSNTTERIVASLQVVHLTILVYWRYQDVCIQKLICIFFRKPVQCAYFITDKFKTRFLDFVHRPCWKRMCF
jgi:hypothetical protein